MKIGSINVLIRVRKVFLIFCLSQVTFKLLFNKELVGPFKLLAKNGMLHEKKATTHWGAFDILEKIDQTITIIKNKRFVFDKYYSSSGVSAGIDMSLHIIEKIYDKTIAQNTAKYMEYKY